jgi:Uncharacterized conserved protein
MPRFICDAMLGSLARWLRFFGYDCLFSEEDDEVILDTARREGRWLLTRDRTLASRGPRSLLVKGGSLEAQLAEVFRRLDLAPEPTLAGSRCAACNGELEAVGRDEVRDAVPPFVAATATVFRRCRSCGRVYWPGSHTGRIVARMRRVCGAVCGNVKR